ncbi:hypothetical protein AB0875_25690 [Micromonospora gifhornensis]|uniref:hypothetical protein n=1 Tax=Micromonospora TaxID=1873 RepID=UPI000F8969DC|nr:hypothetical protein [Verrucosispora sp. FIM060022]RUL94472.1 hypothetical protein EG812_01890 [Verrucosispora sp. FIM060022]
MADGELPEHARRRQLIRRYVDRKVVWRARIYAAVFVVTLGVTLVDAVVAGGWTWLRALVGIVAGVVVGVAASRMSRLRWDGFEQRVVGRIDAIGVVVLVCYLTFSFLRARIVGLWVPASQVAATSMGLLSGAMLGQILGIRRGLRLLGRRLLAQPTETTATGSPADGDHDRDHTR